ncbi:spermidine synthase [Rhizohabitans arisaemae]|uniref:spermidine synthase n=1 Tax=Rhizohabitans arisaemae TaxID=2720610 RepID=UPI0024B0749A|nr:fused MFS/spermidine synthase [Rhizohabitans arisaemae]
MKRKTSPIPGLYSIGSGQAEILHDLDREDGWLLSVNGVPQSYVDLSDPTYLDFEYVRHMADVIDCLEPEGAIDVVHIGGGACTLPRYVAKTRPGSRQIVIEPDGALVELVRSQLAPPRIKIRITDGRSGLAALRDGESDLVILDAFIGARIPGDLVTLEFLHDVLRVLRPTGTYLVNVADGPPLPFARRLVATIRSVFPHVAVVADPGVLRGRHFGNLIVAASGEPLPIETLVRRSAGSIPRGRVVHDEELDRFRGALPPIRDGQEIPVPVPPPEIFT